MMNPKASSANRRTNAVHALHERPLLLNFGALAVQIQNPIYGERETGKIRKNKAIGKMRETHNFMGVPLSPNCFYPKQTLRVLGLPS